MWKQRERRGRPGKIKWRDQGKQGNKKDVFTAWSVGSWIAPFSFIPSIKFWSMLSYDEWGHTNKKCQQKMSPLILKLQHLMLRSPQSCWGCSSVEEHFPSMHPALSLILSTGGKQSSINISLIFLHISALVTYDHESPTYFTYLNDWLFNITWTKLTFSEIYI